MAGKMQKTLATWWYQEGGRGIRDKVMLPFSSVHYLAF